MADEVLGITTLKEKLEELKVPKRYYRIGSYGEEALCIIFENGRWVVFEGERGNRYNVHSFTEECDACAFFLERIKVFL